MKRIVFGLLSSFVLVVGCSSAVENEDDVERAEDALSKGHGHCRTDKDCRRGDYCAYEEKLCGEEGVCRARPEVCTRIYDPVCGCNGVTYGNACEAAAAGVSVSSKGSCARVFCDGIAGIPCPGSGQCVDDPSDDCDPKNGGADCGGICECTQNALCAWGSHFDSSPKVCACVADKDADPCAVVRCRAGSRCVVSGGEARCELADPCAVVRCAAGTHCVANGSTATCVADEESACGKVTCPAGTYCCNASCGMCAPPGVACIQIACL